MVSLGQKLKNMQITMLQEHYSCSVLCKERLEKNTKYWRNEITILKIQNAKNMRKNILQEH